jgi:hypothetical protein
MRVVLAAVLVWLVLESLMWHHARETPPYQGYCRCLFAQAPFLHHRIWWSGERWELRGHPLDTTGLLAWYR